MKLSRLILILSGIVVMMQFNNCSPMANKNGFQSGYLLSTCDPNNLVVNGQNITNPNADIYNVNCAVADNNNLSLDPQGGDISITASQGDFNVAGKCNDGGYPTNTIVWILKYQSSSGWVMVRNSGAVNGQVVNGQCINGRFVLYVELDPIPEDNNSQYNRTGLYEPLSGTRQRYLLEITIIGTDKYGVTHRNMTYGDRPVSLAPL